MIGNKHLVEIVALCYADGDGKHNAVAERHNRRLHVIVSIMSFGDGLRTIKQARLEILVHEVEVYCNVFDAESLAVHLGKRYLSCVVIATVVERNAECNLVFVVVE